MAEYVQLELFDLKPYISRKNTPDIYVVAQSKVFEGIEGEQLKINLFPDTPDESYFNLKRAA